MRPEVEELTVLCYSFAVMGMFLLIFVAAETGAVEPLPSIMISAFAIPAFRQCLPSRCLARDYSVTVHLHYNYV
jgi:hypothetical protein